MKAYISHGFVIGNISKMGLNIISEKEPDMEVLKNAKPCGSGEFWYDLTDGGYIKPEKLVSPEDAKKVEEAVAIIQEFRQTLEENELLMEL